jgi:outer membrane immunogenic protein
MGTYKSFWSLLAIGGSALALVPAQAHAEAFDGPYAGVEAGVGILKSKGATIAGPFSNSASSAVLSAVVGYRMPLGENSPIVVGAEGNVGIYSKGSNARYGVSGIGGVRVSDSGLLYLRAGYGWLDGIQTGLGKGIDGLVLGGGGEVKLTEKLTARADYKYLDYGGVNVPDNIVSFKGHEVVGSVLLNF